MERLSKKQKQAIADKLSVNYPTIRELCTVSQQLQRCFEVACNGADREKLPSESWGQYDIYRDKCLQSYEVREENLRAKAKKLADSFSLSLFIQSDPRGCSIYVSRNESMNDCNYSNTGIALY